MNSTDFLKRRPLKGFCPGETQVFRAAQSNGPGFDFGIVRLKRGDRIEEVTAKESAWVLLAGAVEVRWSAGRVALHRRSVFAEGPSTFHAGAGERVALAGMREGCELAVVRAANSRKLEPRLFPPSDVPCEYRGEGLVQDACLREVRLIFDRSNRPGSNLVVGEVINYPGRWSSYPPHHHAQPEVYHYRFTQPAGYGHAEVGEEVLKVRDGDTIAIPPDRDHAQVSAPGYGMYYLWAIRHLRGNPYNGFTFAPEHAWALERAKQGWRPPHLKSPRK